MPTCEILDTFPLGAVATGLSMAMIDPIVIAQVDAGNPWFQAGVIGDWLCDHRDLDLGTLAG